ncbi:cytochrome P450 oxidoreductase [Nemania sp. FL0916]|nr:cytochrome P450 oxidoreductase [Nemania sp. FL0916]
MSSTNTTIVAVGATGFYILIWALLRLTQDAREPPAVENAVPFLSPIVGMQKKGADYHKDLHNKHKLPIHTLRLPGFRLYVVNDTALIPIIQRQSKTLSISPMVVRVFSHFMGVSPQALNIMGCDPMEDHGFVHQITLQTVEGIKPGPNLDALVARAAGYLSNSIDAIRTINKPMSNSISAANTTKPLLVVNMFEWTTTEIMLATTNAVYGRRNPFKDPSVQAAYREYEAGLLPLITGFLPSLTAPKSLKARETIVEAFVKYYEEGGLGDKSSSVYAQNRHDYPLQLGISVRDIAKLEAGGSFGLLGNTMPATFWTIYHIFSDPGLLQKCRAEVQGAVHEKDGQSYVDISYIKASCPLIVATMQETFRFHSVGMSARAVVDDHLLDGKYLLKKGATLLIPSNVQHELPEAWGEDFDKFRPTRFIRDASSRKKYNSTAFRAFGGGVNLCPGRHFASTEILAFASILLLQFDMVPTAGWDTLGYKQTNASFRVPSRDVRVQLIPRADAATRGWKPVFSSPGKPMELTTTSTDNDALGNEPASVLSLGWVGSLVLEVPRDPAMRIRVRGPGTL